MNKIDFIEPDSLSSSDRIAIYGYGSQGITFYNMLMKSQSAPEVVSFIDSYQSTSHYGVPVYKFSDLPRSFYSGVKIIIASTFWQEIADNFKTMNDVEVYILSPNTFTDWNQYYPLIVKIVNKISRLNMLSDSDVQNGSSSKIVLHCSPVFQPLGMPGTCVEANVNHHNSGDVEEILNSCAYEQLILCPRTHMDLYFYYNILSRIQDNKHVCIMNPIRRYEAVFIIEDLSCIYLPIPKCATTSILSMLHKDFGDGAYGHWFSSSESQLKFIDIDKFDFSDYFTFTFVRSPFGRAVSLYNNHFSPNVYMNDILCKEYSKDRLEFSDLVDFISRCPDCFSDIHFRSQHQFISRSDGTFVPDFIGDLENFEYFWEEIASRTGIQPMKRNASKWNSNLYEQYYTEDIKEKIEVRYATDFKLPRGYIK